MDQLSPVMVIIASENDQAFAHQVANALGYPSAHIIIGSPLDAARTIGTRAGSPLYIVIDIGNRTADVLPEIDTLAEQCEPGTRVVVVGNANDVVFYRELKQRGVIEYFPHPAKVADIRSALLNFSQPGAKSAKGKVISFVSAASGDGSSTLALNTAYCLAEIYQQSTVIVDMDYQFGMVAKNLDLNTQYGIKELFEHPDRGIDSTLIGRMLAEYGEHLKVIASPNNLRLMPPVRPEVIRDLIFTLREQYDYVIIDLPHVWTTWVGAALSNSSHIVMVAQLWLRSVTHASRLLAVTGDIGIEKDAVSLAINRSGAKFKEAVSAKDFERVCAKTINFFISNDIKAVVEAENHGKTILETNAQTAIARELRQMAESFLPTDLVAAPGSAIRSKPLLGGLFARKP